MRQYNEKRPHQALLNYTPGFIHRLGNKTKLLNLYKHSVQIVKEQRIFLNRLKKETFDACVNY